LYNSQLATSHDTSSKKTITTGVAFREAYATISVFIEPPHFDTNCAKVTIDTGASQHATGVKVESKSQAETHIKDRFAAIKDDPDKIITPVTIRTSSSILTTRMSSRFQNCSAANPSAHLPSMCIL
jgi:hypothetical protein